MAGVRFSGPNNSTLFTTCCGVAICDDQSRCPSCKEEVALSPRARWEMAMEGQMGGKKQLAELRASYSKEPIDG